MHFQHYDAGFEPPPNRPNPLHVAWLLAGHEQWNNRRRASDFRPDLGGIQLTRVFREHGLVDDYESGSLAHYNLRDADLTYANLGGVNLNKVNLARADLRNANAPVAEFTEAILTEAKLDKSYMPMANFRGVRASEAKFRLAAVQYSDFSDGHLEGSDFLGATMFGSKFRGASLGGTRLTCADLFRADLVRCELSGSRIWKANLFTVRSPMADRGQPCLGIEKVESIEDLMGVQRALRKLRPDPGEAGRSIFDPDPADDADKWMYYFRGESCYGWPLSPSAMRGEYRAYEAEALTSLETERPGEFDGLVAAIERLGLARHYGLPTRLLDVTRNPLVALFWAAEKRTRSDECCGDISRAYKVGCGTCDSEELECTGVVHAFVVPRDMVCTHDSDKVSVVANFARLSRADQNLLLSKRKGDTVGDVSPDADDLGKPISFSYQSIMTRLTHFIGREKPYFADAIDIRDLFRVLVVEPKQSFERLRAQSGAFMISAFHDRFEREKILKKSAGQPVYWHYKLRVPPGCKETLREELGWMDINQPRLYGDVSTAADGITGRLKEKFERDKSRGYFTKAPPYPFFLDDA